MHVGLLTEGAKASMSRLGIQWYLSTPARQAGQGRPRSLQGYSLDSALMVPYQQ